MTSSKHSVAVHFSAHVLTNFGERVCITGNCAELGNWQPQQSLKLHTNPRQYPLWFSKKIISLPKLTNLQYKICVLNGEGQITRWENLRYNRCILLKNSCSILLTEGEAEVEFDFDNSDSESTNFNSTRKTPLSQIQQQSEDDEEIQQYSNQKRRQYFQRNHSGSDIGRNENLLHDMDFFDDQWNKVESNMHY